MRAGGSSCLLVLVAAGCGSTPALPDAAPIAIDARADAPGPGISISPTLNDWGNGAIGDPKPHARFEISTGSRTGPLSVSIAGTNAGEFAIIGGNCEGAVLAPLATCTLWVTFAPTTWGTKSAALLITGSPGGTTMAALLGTGSGAPQLYSTPSVAHFGTTVVGQTTGTQRFTLTNPSSITTSAVTITKAGSDPTEFEIVTDTCMGQMIAPHATCFVDLHFHPTSTGQKTSSIIFSASSGGSANASLDGTGIASASIAITSPFSDFGAVGYGLTSGPITFTATNTGGSPTATLATSIIQTASHFAIVAGTDTCSGTTLAAGAACTLQVTFTGTQLGSAAATLRVEDGTATGTTTLAAVVVSLDDFNILTPSFGTFPDVLLGGTSAPLAFTLTNIGGTTHGPVSITFGGAAAGAFALVNDTCMGTSLTAGGFCTFGVTFSPSSSGINAGFVQLAATPGGTATVTLRGNGLDPRLRVDMSSLDFGSVATGEHSQYARFQVTNVSPGPVGALATTMIGMFPTEFTIAPATNTCAGTTLTAGATCSVEVRFEPSALQNRSARLRVADATNAVNVDLSGAAGLPDSLAIAPTPFSFGDVTVGQTSAPRTFTISNHGTSTSSPLGFYFGSTVFQLVTATNTCANLALVPGATCTFEVTAHPATTGISTGSGGSFVYSGFIVNGVP